MAALYINSKTLHSNENSSFVEASPAQSGDGDRVSDNHLKQNSISDALNPPIGVQTNATLKANDTKGTGVACNGKRELLASCAGLAILCGVVFGAYHSIVDVGFLLDDYVHLGKCYDAMHGDASGILKTFTGNWSGQTDGLTSFRPGISMSFLFDYMLYGFQAAGYHVTNLLMFSGCAFLCSVIAYQLAGDNITKQAEPLATAVERSGAGAPEKAGGEQSSSIERMLVALVTGVLFSLYPIHAESVSWIVGRVDVHCTFFYLSSICFYIFSRKTGRNALLALGLGSFLVALICKEMAVTLPAVIACAELLLAKPLGWPKIGMRDRIIKVGSFFLMLVAFGVMRTLLLGTLVGGYGSDSLKTTLRALKNFLDPPTFSKILFGVNEEQPFSPVIASSGIRLWIVCGIAFLTRLIQPFSRLRVFLFLILWLVISELPTFQIWHIHPNLVGSRLFFLGSAALCVLLGVALVPAFRLTGPIALNPLAKALTSGVRVLSIVTLAGLAACWYLGLQHNLYAWSEAGRQMQELQTKLKTETRSLPPSGSIVLIDIPQDFSGSGMVGRPEYLTYMFDKPVADADYASRMVTLARPIPGPVEYFYPDVLATVYGDSRGAKWLQWSRGDRGFIEWVKPSGASRLDLSKFDSPVSVDKPKSPTCLWLARGTSLDPFAVGCIEVTFDSSSPAPELARNARLVWRSKKQPKSWIDYSEGPFAEVDVEAREGKLLFLPGRYRSWALNGDVQDVGVQLFPGNYELTVKSIRSVPTASLIPSIALQMKPAESLSAVILPTVRRGDAVSIAFDASGIEQAKKVSITVNKSDKACPDLPTKILPDETQVLFTARLEQTRGTFALPPEVLSAPGKHQLVVLALDANDQPVGYTSEPRTFFVIGQPK
jgi:hypothetical protein